MSLTCPLVGVCDLVRLSNGEMRSLVEVLFIRAFSINVEETASGNLVTIRVPMMGSCIS